MKKIGKNSKLYIIGMIVGGITLGLTTVIADTIINSTNVAYKTTTVKAALDELYDIADFKEEVKDMLYPVGSIYISVSSTNPSELFGGTWISFGEGRTLLGVGSIEANNGTAHGTVTPGEINSTSAGAMGGETKHTLSIAEMPSHNHSGGTLNWPNVLQVPRQTYDNNSIIWLNSGTAGCWTSTPPNNTTGGGALKYTATSYSGTTTLPSGYFNFTCNVSGKWQGTTSASGGSVSHNNMQPYITVYMWKRTA